MWRTGDSSVVEDEKGRPYFAHFTGIETGLGRGIRVDDAEEINDGAP